MASIVSRFNYVMRTKCMQDHGGMIEKEIQFICL